jgi:hypothetical protein
MGRRGGTRYLNIFKGKNKAARTMLIQYFDGERVVSYPSRSGDRPATKRVFVKPFNIPTAAGVYMEEQVSSAKFDAVKAFFSGFVTDTAITADNSFKLGRTISPRAVVTTGRLATGTSDTSKLTGLSYKKYGGNGVSVPFGKGASDATDTEEEVFRSIRNAALNANARNAVSYVPGY